MPKPRPWQPLLLIGATLAVRGLFVLEPPGRDQGLFLTQADLLRHGARLYERVWEHKPPGILALYAVARELGAGSYLSIHLLNAAAVLASAWMLRAIGLRGGLSQAGALCGSLLYVLFAAGPAFGGYWMTAQPEVFLDPLLCAALLLSAAGTFWAALLAGVAVGVAVAAIKYSALPLVLLVLLQSRRAGLSVRIRRARFAFVLGCALPPASLFAYFAATGRATAWFEATVRFNLEHASVGRAAFWDDPVTLALPLLLGLFVFYVFGAFAAVDRIVRGGKHRAQTDSLLYVGAALWVLALLQVILQGKFWTYHYHVMLIPLSILAAVGFDRMRARAAPRWGERRAIVVCTTVALVSGASYLAQSVLYVRQHQLVAALAGDVSDDAFYLRYAWGHNDYNFGVDRIVAAQVAKATRADDRVFIWGFEPVIYSLAQRQPASRFLYDYPLMPRFSAHARYVRELLGDLRARPPALILVLRGDRNDLEAQDSASQLQALPELAEYLQRGYEEAWNAGNFVCYARR
jgi:hypothetical protein